MVRLAQKSLVSEQTLNYRHPFCRQVTENVTAVQFLRASFFYAPSQEKRNCKDIFSSILTTAFFQYIENIFFLRSKNNFIL